MFEIPKWPEATLPNPQENNNGCGKLENNCVLLELPGLKHEYYVLCTCLESIGVFASAIL